MPNEVFILEEATIDITPSGLQSQTIGFARRMERDRQRVTIETGKTVYFQDRISIDSVWVDSDVQTVDEHAGPFTIKVAWVNNDGRQVSYTWNNVTGISGRKTGALGDPNQYTLEFNALTSA